ncbi:MAG: heavy metal translocating P-type ATPase metal-binding domain-containing protein, partial [Bacteroidota bacterium]
MNASIATSTKTKCYHCGEDCSDKPLQKADRAFCCQGCLIVYELLEEHDLCAFYEMGEGSLSTRPTNGPQDYSWLDAPPIQQQLLDYYDEQLCKLRLSLPQMHCSACIWLLEQLYQFNPGILQSRVNFLKKEIYLSYDPRQLSLRQLVELLASLGYAPELSLHDLEATPETAVSKRLLYQMGLAGFVFGNTMLLSFPEYLGLDALREFAFYRFFAYLNLLLAIPLVVYCGQDYLRSAANALQRRELNIDIPISLGILTLLLRSVYEIVSQTGPGFLDSLAGLIFFLLIGRWFQQQSYHRLSFERDYKSYFPIATQLSSGQSVAISSLQKGDRIVVRHGELIPADAVLREGAAQIDYSFVTGESAPIQKDPGDLIFAGGRQTGAAIELEVQRPVRQSYLTQLWNDQAFQQETEQHTVLSSDAFGRYFTIFVLVVAAATLLYWLPQDSRLAVNAFTAVLIIACPCAIALTIPFTYGNALRFMARENCYIKSVEVLQRFREISAIVFDKTGTLTQNNEQIPIQYQGEKRSISDRRLIASLAAQSGHPISQQIVAESGVREFWPVSAFKEHVAEGIEGVVNEVFVRIGRAGFIGVGEEAAPGTYVQIDGVTVGYYHQSNSYRQGIPDLLSELQHKYQCYLLSGDQDSERSQLSKWLPAKNLHFEQR